MTAPELETGLTEVPSMIITMFKNVGNVLRGRRWLTVIESAKLGDRAYELAVDIATANGMPHRCVQTYGEDGVTLSEAVFIAQRESVLEQALQTVYFGQQHASYYPLTRNYIAKWMGKTLGYSALEVKTFVDGEVHRSCACSLCGGPYKG